MTIVARKTNCWNKVDLGLEDKTMKAAANTQYRSGFIDGREFFHFLAHVLVTETGAPTVGDAKLSLELYDDEKQLITTVDLMTAIDTQTDAQESLVSFGAMAAGSAGGDSGTVGGDVDLLKTFGWIKLLLEVTTQNDGTTSAASVTLFGERN